MRKIILTMTLVATICLITGYFAGHNRLLIPERKYYDRDTSHNKVMEIALGDTVKNSMISLVFNEAKIEHYRRKISPSSNNKAFAPIEILEKNRLIISALVKNIDDRKVAKFYIQSQSLTDDVGNEIFSSYGRKGITSINPSESHTIDFIFNSPLPKTESLCLTLTIGSNSFASSELLLRIPISGVANFSGN